MSAKITFDEALDAAIDAMARGEHADEVVARYPTYADSLRPLAEFAAASQRHAARAHVPVSPRLAANFSSVAAAIRRAGLTAVPDSGRSTFNGHWWQRRLTFASLSLPAGAFALLTLVGISSAAAASAVTGDAGITQRVADAARAVTPDWVPVAGHSSTPGSSARAGTSGSDPVNGDATAGLPTNEGLAGGGSAGGATPGSTNGRQDVTASGVIADVHGNVFTLVIGDGDLKVNVDGSTHVNGTIVDGATATVVGDLSDGKNLHASSVDVTSLSATPNAAPDNPADASESPSPQDGHTPGPPPDHTPGPPDDRTPGPPADQTPPGQGGEPPGQSTAGPPGSDNGNGNGNGGGQTKP